MGILFAAVFLLTIHALGVSGQQQQSCPDVQQKLQALSEAVQSLCELSTPLPSTAQPTPVVLQQQCDCSPAVNWTSVPRTTIGTSNLRQAGTLAYDIPSVIPSSAKEVLVLTVVFVSSSGPSGHTHYVKIYTEQNQKQYEKYIFLISHSQSASVTNSDNLWFPMTSGRQVFVKSEIAHTSHVNFEIHAIGYR